MSRLIPTKATLTIFYAKLVAVPHYTGDVMNFVDNSRSEEFVLSSIMFVLRSSVRKISLASKYTNLERVYLETPIAFFK
ncbi:hypothetical protein ANN_24103 [Periplaneta americana]|uniref:Per a allergen n=1 Tax=Periplaneta americana TaxID=6978 RepID=A0ABQ8S2G7_PERAM|nr:hypothetical protein ANN_24103 [Periplaneta americana]